MPIIPLTALSSSAKAANGITGTARGPASASSAPSGHPQGKGHLVRAALTRAPAYGDSAFTCARETVNFFHCVPSPSALKGLAPSTTCARVNNRTRAGPVCARPRFPLDPFLRGRISEVDREHGPHFFSKELRNPRVPKEGAARGLTSGPRGSHAVLLAEF